MLLLAAAVLVILVAVVLTLGIRPQDVPPPEPPSPTRHLEERRAAIYENLRDLQFEYRVGKLSDADYQQSKVGLQKELAGVLSEIDRLGAKAPAQKAEDRRQKTEAPAPVAASNMCPHCGASFPNPMKFCGECGKAMG